MNPSFAPSLYFRPKRLVREFTTELPTPSLLPSSTTTPRPTDRPHQTDVPDFRTTPPFPLGLTRTCTDPLGPSLGTNPSHPLNLHLQAVLRLPPQASYHLYIFGPLDFISLTQDLIQGKSIASYMLCSFSDRDLGNSSLLTDPQILTDHRHSTLYIVFQSS
jgi:hypothetical protein